MSVQTEFGQSALTSGYFGNQAAEKTSQATFDAAQLAIQEQRRQYDQSRTDKMPWMQAGQGAVNQLSDLMQQGGQLYNTTPTIEQLQMDPGYAWRTQQGANALAAQGAASGMYGSGNLGVALTDYGQNAASQEYQNAYNRWNTAQDLLYNRLAGISGTGQTSANQLGALGQTTANQIGSYYQNSVTPAYDWSSAIMGSAGAVRSDLSSGLQNYLNWQGQQNKLNMAKEYMITQPSYGYSSNGVTGTNNWAGGDIFDIPPVA
jgi:hypothetical protein